MPWVRASLRGQTIYARTDAAGAFAVEDGGVEIRYKPHDGRKYKARAENLTVADPKVLPDDTCGPAETVAKARAGEAEGAGGAGAPAAAGPARAQRKAPARGAPAEAPVPEGAVVVYADGACSGNPGPAGLGVVILDGGGRVELSEYLGTGTNNIAELTAILRAVEEVEPGRPLVIHTDSQYSIGVLQKGWKAKANTELVAKVLVALKERRPRPQLVYVPGHAGVLLNERADALAREAVRERTKRRAVYPPTDPAKLAQG
ncbi:uncharacterized protein SOCE26_014320 [Sorangium cellulosum]|uniref:ribonuclease H n=1 Tax=Sorangium cellulosum TaxID=56 RepID=A0A2L0EL71_SORCE|nr:ribonuclease H [Sorangium cellulosum]AUX40037.1 uncharacterized protein SOCE26_014320 [Sorangium cellulosum]